MVTFVPHKRRRLVAAEDRTGSGIVPPIDPRHRLEARTRIERLRARLLGLCGEAAHRLHAAVGQFRVLAPGRGSPRARAVLCELEVALAEIQELATSEFIDVGGVKRLHRRLTLASEDLRLLRGEYLQSRGGGGTA